MGERLRSAPQATTTSPPQMSPLVLLLLPSITFSIFDVVRVVTEAGNYMERKLFRWPLKSIFRANKWINCNGGVCNKASSVKKSLSSPTFGF